MIIQLKFRNRLKYWDVIHLKSRSIKYNQQTSQTFLGGMTMTTKFILNRKRRKLLNDKRNKKLLHNIK